MRGVVALVLLAVVLAGCSSLKERTAAKPDAFAGIRTIQVEDKTNPILLRASDAGLIADLVDTALKGNGYHTCTAPCEADATAIVKVTTFANRRSVDHIHLSPVRVNVIAFNFQLHDKAGVILMETESKKKSDMPRRELAAMLVEDLALRIPTAK